MRCPVEDLAPKLMASGPQCSDSDEKSGYGVGLKFWIQKTDPFEKFEDRTLNPKP